MTCDVCVFPPGERSERVTPGLQRRTRQNGPGAAAHRHRAGSHHQGTLFAFHTEGMDQSSTINIAIISVSGVKVKLPDKRFTYRPFDCYERCEMVAGWLSLGTKM